MEGVTDKERAVIEMLAHAWNGFISLFPMGQHDRQEFQSAIHAAQKIVMARVARRANPELFRLTD